MQNNLQEVIQELGEVGLVTLFQAKLVCDLVREEWGGPADVSLTTSFAEASPSLHR